MVHIRIAKTIHGYAYSLVEEFTSTTKDIDGKDVSKTEFLPLDYKVGKEILPAVFPYNQDGLDKAKEIQKIYKK